MRDREGAHGAFTGAAARRRQRRRSRIVLGSAALLFVLAVGVASRLRLDASMNALLPARSTSAGALVEADQRIGELSTMVVLIHSPHPGSNVRYAHLLAERVREAMSPLVERVVEDLGEERAFLERHGWLLLEEDLLRDVRDRLRREIDGRKNPLLVFVDEPPTLAVLRDRLAARRTRLGPLSAAGAINTDEGRVVALVLLPRRAARAGNDQGQADEADEALERALRAVIARTPPSSIDPAIEWHLAGEVHTTLAERRSTQSDMALVSVCAVLLVGLVIYLYFRRWRSLALVAAPVALGVALALALAFVLYAELNSISAFLGSVIVGNGINFPILLLSRYDEERARGRGAERAIRIALSSMARPTALAAFAASVSFASLAFTHFRGFSQFGVIGGAGMLLCWAATMTVLPALLRVLDGGQDGRLIGPVDLPQDAPAPRRKRGLALGRPAAWLVTTAPRALIVGGLLLSAVSAFAIARWLADPFEYDFQKLRRTSAEARSPDIEKIFGRALSPSVLLGGSKADAEAAAEELRRRARDQRASPIARVVTLEDLLAGAPDGVRRKRALIAEIRALLAPSHLTLLSDEQRRVLADLSPPNDTAPWTLDDIPSLLRRPFTERDGSTGRVVLIYPPTREQGFSLTDGHDLLRLAAAIRDVDLPDGIVLHATGRPVIFAAMLESIAHDAPRSTALSFAAVAILTLLLARPRAGGGRSRVALVILGSLLLGVLWMLGVAALLSVKLNMLNFLALPITFGIGVDYAANVYLRFAAERRPGVPSLSPSPLIAGAVAADAPARSALTDGDNAARVLCTTGGAVVLNSLTTTIGYGTLLLAANGGLRSFGALAVQGEIGCLSAAVLFLPAVLVVCRRRAADRVGPGHGGGGGGGGSGPTAMGD